MQRILFSRNLDKYISENVHKCNEIEDDDDDDDDDDDNNNNNNNNNDFLLRI